MRETKKPLKYFVVYLYHWNKFFPKFRSAPGLLHIAEIKCIPQTLHFHFCFHNKCISLTFHSIIFACKPGRANDQNVSGRLPLPMFISIVSCVRGSNVCVAVWEICECISFPNILFSLCAISAWVQLFRRFLLWYLSKLNSRVHCTHVWRQIQEHEEIPSCGFTSHLDPIFQYRKLHFIHVSTKNWQVLTNHNEL